MKQKQNKPMHSARRLLIHFVGFGLIDRSSQKNPISKGGSEVYHGQFMVDFYNLTNILRNCGHLEQRDKKVED